MENCSVVNMLCRVFAGKLWFSHLFSCKLNYQLYSQGMEEGNVQDFELSEVVFCPICSNKDYINISFAKIV